MRKNITRLSRSNVILQVGALRHNAIAELTVLTETEIKKNKEKDKK